MRRGGFLRSNANEESERCKRRKGGLFNIGILTTRITARLGFRGLRHAAGIEKDIDPLYLGYQAGHECKEA
jgi:hypothetical protein